MEQIAELEARIARLEEQVAHVWRVGKVTGRDPAKATARVEVPDLRGGHLTYNLPILYPKTLKDQFYWLPDVGEHVVCLFAPTGAELGFVLGAFYSKADRPPTDNPDKYLIKFKDGAVMEYDRGAHDWQLTTPGTATIDAPGNLNLNP